MTNVDEKATQLLQQQFGEAIQEIIDFRGERTIIVPSDKVHAICHFLRHHEELQYNFITDIVADDMLPEYPRFAVNYHLRSMPRIHNLRLRTFVEDPDEGPQTVGDIWKVGTWLEMEVWDLMGIKFAGNGALRRLFLPEDWVGHPLRKDYPLGYEEVQFSFNWEAIQAKKPYAGSKRIVASD
ncbi:MAG: NADH-quinone oxidoreductase subunit C [Chloroflexi bacterium]|nr:NADH-quinone oxidoreductase subunit C [Chloroflexota bacterium]